MSQATNNNYEIIEKISNKIGETNVLIADTRKAVSIAFKAQKENSTYKTDTTILRHEFNGLVNYKRGLIEALEMIKEIDNNNY